MEKAKHMYPHFSLSWAEIEVQASLKPLLDKVRISRHLTKTAISGVKKGDEVRESREEEEREMEEGAEWRRGKKGRREREEGRRGEEGEQRGAGKRTKKALIVSIINSFVWPRNEPTIIN